MSSESVGAFGELIYIISSLKLHDIIVSNAPDDDNTPRQQFDLYFLINRFLYDTRDGAMQQQLRGDDERRWRVGREDEEDEKLTSSAREYEQRREARNHFNKFRVVRHVTHIQQAYSRRKFSRLPPHFTSPTITIMWAGIVDAIIDNKAVLSHPPPSVVRRTSIQFTRFAEASYRFLIRPTKSSL